MTYLKIHAVPMPGLPGYARTRIRDPLRLPREYLTDGQLISYMFYTARMVTIAVT